MPIMLRMKGKPRDIAYAILGIPVTHNKPRKRAKVRRTLDYEGVSRIK